MIDFVGLPHRNHAFSHSYLFLGQLCFALWGVPINYLAPLKNSPGVEGRLN